MKMKKILYYTKSNGITPFIKFMNKLKSDNKKLFAKILFRIDLLSDWNLWSDDMKYIWNKIYELRIKHSSNISRVFYCLYEWNTIIILDGIIKKQHQISVTIYKQIIQYRKDYINRYWK